MDRLVFYTLNRCADIGGTEKIPVMHLDERSRNTIIQTFLKGVYRMKVTQSHLKLTEEDKSRFIEEITRKMLEIVKKKRYNQTLGENRK